MKNVLILKSESDNSDNYGKLLKENNFNPIFIPTLDFKFKNTKELAFKVSSPQNYAGVIFTSPRSVSGVKSALNDGQLSCDWSRLHNYCVGEATYELCRTELGIECHGRDTGNANNLVDVIKTELAGETIAHPFLFPCGNLRQNILVDRMNESGFQLEEIEIYETIPHPNLEENLTSNFTPDSSPEALVFFSPSGINFCYEILERMGGVRGHKLIAIGPSTRKAIESCDWSVHRTTEKPNPESLLYALLH